MLIWGNAPRTPLILLRKLDDASLYSSPNFTQGGSIRLKARNSTGRIHCLEESIQVCAIGVPFIKNGGCPVTGFSATPFVATICVADHF